MTAGTCSATIHVVGIGTFTCEVSDPAGHEVHSAILPSDGKWASVSWTGDTASIGARRGLS